jgi:hypothetical protein
MKVRFTNLLAFAVLIVITSQPAIAQSSARPLSGPPPRPNQPAITSFTPTSGGSNTSVVITGKNFTGATSVTCGGKTTQFTVTSPTSITMATIDGTSGKIIITTPSGAATSTGSYTSLFPTLTAITPTLVVNGSTAQLSGSHFTGATSVKFGGVDASSFIVKTDSRIDAVVGGGTTFGNISVEVTTPNGSVSSTSLVKKLIPPGESYGGGVVIWTDSTGLHGLIVSTTDLGTSVPWGTAVTTGATSSSDGAANTSKITTAVGNAGSYAAKLCADYRGGGFSDWFLPSKDQLLSMMLVSDTSGGPIAGIGLSKYWSSTEGDVGNAFYLQWKTPSTGAKTNHLRVRAMRAF